MYVESTESPSQKRSERLDTDAPILDPWFDPRSVARCSSLLCSLQQRGPERRREAMGCDGSDDRYTLDEIAQVKTLQQRPPLANVARAAEACGFPIVLVWRDGEPFLGVDFEGKCER